MSPAKTSFIHRAATALEDSSALDPLVEKFEPVGRAFVANPLVRDALQGRWVGHAIHPALTDAPLGAWGSALVLDVVGGERARDAATLLTGLGVLAAVPTAWTGWAEWAEAEPRAKRVGAAHVAAVGTTIVLQGASWIARRRGRRELGVALSALATIGMGLGSHLGGHLAVSLKVGTRQPS